MVSCTVQHVFESDIDCMMHIIFWHTHCNNNYGSTGFGISNLSGAGPGQI